MSDNQQAPSEPDDQTAAVTLTGNQRYALENLAKDYIDPLWIGTLVAKGLAHCIDHFEEGYTDYEITDAGRALLAQASASVRTSARAEVNTEPDTSAIIDHLSTQWVQIHQLLSEALGLDFEPNEDIERYIEAIDELRNQKHNEAFAAGYSAGQAELAARRQQLADAEAANGALKAALVQAEMSFQEAAEYAESEYPTDATVAIIARTGERLARSALAASRQR